ncbi:MAG: glycosyl transferase, family 25 [Chthoniobacter sp.]|nr:glycosyl transferase, family 25 [Chthoniobacter sp.]
MKAFVINLDRAPERWAHIEQSFAGTAFQLCRVPAVDGNGITLPTRDFSERGFRRLHGRGTNPFEIACYWSHVKAMAAFLQTTDEHAMICEDDIVPEPKLDEVVKAALRHARFWNVLRLSGLSAGKPWMLTRLHDEFSLCLHTQRLKGAGAYIVDRRAAQAFVNGLLPMKLPFDHAMDREWVFGLTAAAVTPFPISQTERKFRSSIQSSSQPHLSPLLRLFATYPYQVANEVSRWCVRHLQLAHFKLRGAST